MWDHIQLIVAGLYLVVQLCGLWMAIDVVMRGRTAQGAIAWALALLLFPLITLPFYFVFGERKFEGYVKARRRGNTEIDRVAKEFHSNLTAFIAPLPAESADLAAAERLARVPFTTSNSVALLIDGQATFDAILRDIEAARSYILIQFYIVRDDGLGRKVRDALIAARKRGVRVMMLYDEIGSYFLPAEYVRAICEAGGDCRGFRTKARRQRPWRLNFRNHRKIVVVDGRTAYIGGHNIGDEYLGLGPLGPWRDTHLRIEGPAALGAQLSFLEDWHWATHEIPPLDWKPDPTGESRVLVVPSGPADALETCALLFTHLANHAKKTLWIATPYFVPDEAMVAALQLAALRGVDVRVIIPEKTDNRLVWLSAFTYYDEVLPAGVKLYRYDKGFLHQKVILCDEISCIGTANLDNRSFRINFEVSAVVIDEKLAAATKAMLEADLERSRAVDRQEYARLPFLFRLAARVSRLLAPIQ